MFCLNQQLKQLCLFQFNLKGKTPKAAINDGKGFPVFIPNKDMNDIIKIS